MGFLADSLAGFLADSLAGILVGFLAEPEASQCNSVCLHIRLAAVQLPTTLAPFRMPGSRLSWTPPSSSLAGRHIGR